LLAQLNPIPVAVSAGLSLVAIGALLMRRRKRSSSRPKTVSKTTVKSEGVAEKAPVATVAAEPPAAATATPPEDEVTESVAPLEPAAAMPEVVATPPVAVAPPPSTINDARRERVTTVTEQARKLFEGANYDQSIIGSNDRETRRLVGAELLSALVGRNEQRRERAREAFMKHGYFDDATSELRIAESDNERAAAARRLSFVHDREATPHLIGALTDPSPDVRRAAVEALMDLRDPSAIGSLNSLLHNENDRKVPRTLIQRAIESCATSGPEEQLAVSPPAPESPSQPTSPAVETEREVIEI
jgi:hypothetical protein